ncbi:1-phosphofructokinase family hexose kinase [Terrimonas sp. NA20]|uniref:1-phosphofructokinase family hexose kinase n=1 Tax=Terrimonas ginsenosidimutans TaxID=2908004 RepID=A0ABS9KVD4_9BACT|nr:1-phosphofructokinase family hexose kinase [Terrimonas ginsenosidimutans]MCG2616286.1 1-phosphofructokinase family hexose kinase [Terrimonas ginsenosidimutans]
MTNIVTLTFSPSVDKSFSSPRFIPSKKLYCSAPRYNAGGGGINVARALRRLGGSATAIFPSGGRTGELLAMLLRREEVPLVEVKVKSDTRENIMITELDPSRHYQFILPPPEFSAEEYEAVFQVLRGATAHLDYLVISGSMPANFPSDMFSNIRSYALQQDCRLVVDTSGTSLVHALEAGIYLAKPNLNELRKLTGLPVIDMAEAEAAAKGILSKYSCEALVVSLGKEGAMLVTRLNTFLFKGPDTDVKTTVGAGDSMVAGMIRFLSMGRSLQDAVKFGVACGTAATLHEGTELCHLADCERLYKLVKEVSR